MAVHVFVCDEKNYKIAVLKGLAGIPNHKKRNINDALISRMSMIKKDDLVLFYIKGKKELHGVFKILECPFYDDTPVWGEKDDGQCWPFRVRIDNSKFSFNKPIMLSDIYDLKDNGLIWTFSLRRATSTNVMFSISDAEYEELLSLFLKLNPIYSSPIQIQEPYPYFKPNLLEGLYLQKDYSPKYEYTLMALILNGFSRKEFSEVFGNYSDFLGYVPTSFEKEIDALLIFNSPINRKKVIAYNIIEVKRDDFDEKALAQLLQYEDWFLRKRVNGDYSMLRTTAIANSFSDKVIEYLIKREQIEKKSVLLLKYINTDKGLNLKKIEKSA